MISNDGSVGEVKRNRGKQVEKGRSQLKKYTENVWRGHEDIKLKVGDSLPSGNFNYESGYYIYNVSYSYISDGMIGYDYTIEINRDKVAQYAATAVFLVSVVGLGIAITAIGVSTGGTAPVGVIAMLM